MTGYAGSSPAMTGYYPGPYPVQYSMTHGGGGHMGSYPSSPAGAQPYYSDMTYSMPPTSQYIVCDPQGLAYQYQPASPYGSVAQWVASPVYVNGYQMVHISSITLKGSFGDGVLYLQRQWSA
jgi:hypothetical protein